MRSISTSELDRIRGSVAQTLPDTATLIRKAIDPADSLPGVSDGRGGRLDSFGPVLSGSTPSAIISYPCRVDPGARLIPVERDDGSQITSTTTWTLVLPWDAQATAADCWEVVSAVDSTAVRYEIIGKVSADTSWAMESQWACVVIA